MTKSAEALITKEILVWARESLNMDIDTAASKLKISSEKLISWENGKSRPLVNKLYDIAHLYKRPFAAFYLPDVSLLSKHSRLQPRDYRRPPTDRDLSELPELMLDIRSATDRRDICLELFQRQQEAPPTFNKKVSLDEDPEKVGTDLDKLLGIDINSQRTINDAFNRWREAIENKGILVFQFSNAEIPVREVRAYSIAEFPLPIISVNRKDAYAGRIFSMLHEIAHLMLRLSGICDLDIREGRSAEDQRIEAFCNHVAGAALVPQNSLLGESLVKTHNGQIWDEGSLMALAKRFKVSSEVILRRLLILGRTNKDFYESKREQYLKEIEERGPRINKEKGFIPPATNALSIIGKPFIKLALSSYYSNRITSSDLSEYLGVKIKHIEKIKEKL